MAIELLRRVHLQASYARRGNTPICEDRLKEPQEFLSRDVARVITLVRQFVVIAIITWLGVRRWWVIIWVSGTCCVFAHDRSFLLLGIPVGG